MIWGIKVSLAFRGSWCADVAVVALGFLAFGYAMQDLLKKFYISYVGTLTFGIFILHKPFLQEVCMGILGEFGITAFEFWPVLGASFVTLILCCYAIKVINRFVPQLMGRFPDLDGHSDFNK